MHVTREMAVTGLKKLIHKFSSRMSTFELVFNRKVYPVPTESVSKLLNHRRALMGAKRYPVRSSVPADTFEAFIDSLKTQTKVTVTRENAASVWLLANEFFLPEVASECSTFSVPVDQFSLLCERFSKLERQLSSFTNPLRKIEDAIGSGTGTRKSPSDRRQTANIASGVSEAETERDHNRTSSVSSPLRIEAAEVTEQG
jgi:hypothetical protein